MLSRRRCPYTGIINFFAETEPHLAVGSVAQFGAPAQYAWRCYLAEEGARGVADDLMTAEHRLARRYLQSVEQHSC